MEERVIMEKEEEKEVITGESPNNPLFNHRNRCSCFHFPCFGPSPTTTTTTRHVTLGGAPGPTTPPPISSLSTSSLWDRFRTAPVRAFKKIREWSEIVAGPQWKTFIRRFNRKRHNHQRHHQNGKLFQYDPLSYALNFDEGQNGNFDEEFVNGGVGGGGGQFPDFNSRLAASPPNNGAH